jgi:hypothetical protein
MLWLNMVHVACVSQVMATASQGGARMTGLALATMTTVRLLADVTCQHSFCAPVVETTSATS